MKHIPFYLLIALIAACSAPNKPSQSAVNSLEQPPSYSGAKVAKEIKEDDTSSITDKNSNKGLSDDVHRDEDNNHVLLIKRPVDEAWALLGEAIRLKELEVTARNRKQGLYEVEYKADSLFGGFNLFGFGTPSTYLLKLESQNNGTKLSVSKKADDNEDDESLLKDGAPEYSRDNSSKLADMLFDTLQKNVTH